MLYVLATVGNQMVAHHTYMNENGERTISPIGRNNEPPGEETTTLLTVAEVKQWLNDKGVRVTMKEVQGYRLHSYHRDEAGILRVVGAT